MRIPRRSSRRSFCLKSAGTLGASVLGARSVALATGGSAPPAEVHERRVISHLPQAYHGWPTLARRRNGELMVVCSGGRAAHVCPFGRVELMRSKDDGETWSWPQVVMDGPIDDRDAGALETAAGTLLVTTFTSLAYEPLLQKSQDWEPDRRARWLAAHRRVGEAERQQALGVWVIRSTDGGITWSGRRDSLVNSPHGPIQLSDGRLLYAGKDLWRTPHRVGVCHSSDDGQTWRWLAEIPVRDGDDQRDYHELHAVETEGKIVVHLRNHNARNNRETLQSVSHDGGQTWSPPQAIGVWGLPSHLLRLSDGRLLMSYGHRRSPLGNQARISEDQGRSWSGPISISADGTSGDLGYPSTVQLSDQSLVTIWYERLKSSPLAQLRQARWTLVG